MAETNPIIDEYVIVDDLAEALRASDPSRYEKYRSMDVAMHVYNVLTGELGVDKVELGKKLGEAKLIADLHFDIHLDYLELFNQLSYSFGVKKMPEKEREQLENDHDASVLSVLRLCYDL